MHDATGTRRASGSRVHAQHGILDDVTTHAVEVSLPRLPGQHELPSEDGEPMETQRHYHQCKHLIETLGAAMRTREDVYVAGNMFVYFSPRQLKNEFFRGPDVFVVVGAEKKERLSWVLWEEMRLPDVVIELTSPSTRDEDYGRKKDIYERVWKTAVYVIYDPATHHIDAWELDAGRYVPATRTAEGDIDVGILGMRLGMRALPLDATIGAPSLRWIAGDGAPLPTYETLVDRAGDLDNRASEAEARASEAETRVAALEAEVERLRAR